MIATSTLINFYHNLIILEKFKKALFLLWVRKNLTTLLQETITTTTEEGDLASGMKTVKFEKVTVRKSVKQVVSSTFRKTSRTPSEERVYEDSAYMTQSNGNLATTSSKTSSVTSLSGGRFPSEESLRRTPSEGDGLNESYNESNSSKMTSSSSSEWYNEYRTQSLQSGSSKLEYVRSKSQYDEHIASIRGQIFDKMHLSYDI